MRVELNGKKILVTFLMHLGDLTLTTPFIHALRKAAPRARISMLVDHKLRDVVLHNPYLDEVLTIDKKGEDDNIAGLWRCAGRLSAMDFDAVINLHPNERCSFICAMTRTKIRAGAAHFIFRPFWHVRTPLDRTRHAADMYLNVLEQLGVKQIIHDGLEIFPGGQDFAGAEIFWQEQGIASGDRLIGFNIGSAVVTKRWAPERFAAVADAFADRGYKTVFFGGSMDLEMVREAAAHMRSTPVLATGAFSIGGLAAAMRRCSLIITNDSGPMHVAISQKVPIVALYGPSSPKLYGPYTDRAAVVTAEPPCSGCTGGMKHQCDDMRCMRELTTAQVLAASDKMLRIGGGHTESLPENKC